MEEQETVIQISRDGETADIWTSDGLLIAKLLRYMKEENSEYKIMQQSKNSEGRTIVLEVQCPKKFIYFRPRIVKRELTDEQRAELVERGRKLYQMQQEKKKEASENHSE